MPILILEDVGPEIPRPERDEAIRCRTGSDDRWPSKTSLSVSARWFIDEEERRAYLKSLLSLLD